MVGAATVVQALARCQETGVPGMGWPFNCPMTLLKGLHLLQLHIPNVYQGPNPACSQGLKGGTSKVKQGVMRAISCSRVVHAGGGVFLSFFTLIYL